MTAAAASEQAKAILGKIDDILDLSRNKLSQIVIAVFATALVWWVAEPVPAHVTSLLMMGLLVFFRDVLNPKEME